MSFGSVTDVVTELVTGILLLVAAAVVLLGVFRAYFGRRHTQLVIADIIAPRELSESLIAELSEDLRREVYWGLFRPDPRRESLNETVGKDVANHIAELRGIDEREVDRIQRAILRAPRQEVLASPRDALAAVSGGIRALKSEQAERFIDALSAALPRQRGLLVGARVVCRRVPDGAQMGLSVQVAHLGRGAEAWATFWSQIVVSADADFGFERPSWFDELLSLAAEWITVNLIGTLGVDATRSVLHLRHRRHARQTHALRDILAAQWASYAMYDLHEERPDVALNWAEQALDDARHARDILPTYYYPSYLVGSINDLCGNCYAALRDRSPADETDRGPADDHFRKAALAFREAEHKLEELAHSKRFRKRHRDEELEHRVETVRIARLKDQMLVDDGAEALPELRNAEITPFDLESTMNAACLFAVAAWVAGKNGSDGSEDRLRACRYVVDAVRQDPTVGFLRTDTDLNRGIARADLDWLLDVAPKADDETVEERLAAIAAGGFASAAH